MSVYSAQDALIDMKKNNQLELIMNDIFSEIRSHCQKNYDRTIKLSFTYPCGSSYELINKHIIKNLNDAGYTCTIYRIHHQVVCFERSSKNVTSSIIKITF